MAQSGLVVAGIDVSKDKVDACIRMFALRQVFPNTAQGHRKLVALLRKHKVSGTSVRLDWSQHPDRSHTSNTFNDRSRTQSANSLSPVQVSTALLFWSVMQSA